MTGIMEASTEAGSVDPTEALRVLRLFNARAEKLNESPFITAVRAGKMDYYAHWERGKGGEVVPNLPDEWDINGFILPFRLFVQKRDGISLECLSELYPKLAISNCLKVRAGMIQYRLKQYMGSSGHGLILDGETVGRQEVFDTVMYGGLAHANVDKQPRHDKWASHPLQNILVYTMFVQTVVEITNAIFWMRLVNRDAIQELEEA